MVTLTWPTGRRALFPCFPLLFVMPTHDNQDVHDTTPRLQPLILETPAGRPLRSWESMSCARKTVRPGELVGVEGAFIEGLLGLISGFAFGFVGTSMGHPADTVKTKRQVRS